MALIRALNTAVSGLKAQQFRIETVGNNIANVDTVGYKTTRTEFSTMLSRMITSGIAPQNNLGGIDPIQLGLGTQVAASTSDWTQGPVKMTGISSDLAIDGDGFFILNDYSGQKVYSRDGTFSINPANLLHDAATGNIVQGWGVDSDFNIQSGGPLTGIEIPVGTLTIARATEHAYLEGNLNSAGTVATEGTWLLSDVFYDNRTTNTDLISGSNPLGMNRATWDTPLENLVRSLGDYTEASGDSAGTKATASLLFPDLAQQPLGLEIRVSADKGSRALEEQTFIVGDPPPKGGLKLGDFVDFLQRSFGINSGSYDGTTVVEDMISFTRHHPVTGEEINGTVSKGLNGGADDQTSLTSIVDHQADFTGVSVGDFIRFTSGTASGEIAEIVGITASTPGGTLDTLNLKSGTINSLIQVPAYGDTYQIHAPAGVTYGQETVLTDLDAADAAVSTGAVTTSGDLSTFILTDTSVTEFSTEAGISVGNEVAYQSGGADVKGRIMSVNGNSVEIGFRSTLTQPPDAASTFTISESPEGTVSIQGNTGSENDISGIDVVAGESRISLFDGPALRTAEDESVSTRLTVYDSLGTARQVDLTFVFQSSTANGPNIFRYYAESVDDADGDPLVGSGTIMFGPDGQFLGTGSSTETIRIDLATTPGQSGGAETPFSFELDLSRLTQLADENSEVLLRDQDGFESGTLRDYSVDADGRIVGVFDNGLIRNLGQVALARFANPNGLQEIAENMYKTAPNSGIPQIGTGGTGGRGQIRGGYLEESNVDLAEQFTELIIGQRAFQANARTVTTSNELLQELVNMM